MKQYYIKILLSGDLTVYMTDKPYITSPFKDKAKMFDKQEAAFAYAANYLANRANQDWEEELSVEANELVEVKVLSFNYILVRMIESAGDALRYVAQDEHEEVYTTFNIYAAKVFASRAEAEKFAEDYDVELVSVMRVRL